MLRHFTRATVALTAATALVFPAVAMGQETPTSPPETGEIGNGTAKATAIINRIGPGVGDLELAVRNGLAVTQVTNNVAQATSHIMDLGLIGGTLTAPNCEGNQYLRPEDLPQSTDADNREGDDHKLDAEGGDPNTLAFGRREVWTTTEPVGSRALTTGGNLMIAPGVGTNSGRSEAITTVLPGEGREAIAVVESSLELGPVVLSGLRWYAHHRTGADPHAEAVFEIGRATIGGLPFPTEDLGALEEVINTVLAPLGTTVTFPTEQRFLEPNDLVRISPLRIRMKDNPTTKTLLDPVLDASREGRSDFFEAMEEAACSLAGALFVGDVVVSILAGTGFVSVDLGGAEAISGPFVIKNPFGGVIPPPSISDLPTTTPPPPLTPSPTPAPSITPAPAISSTPTTQDLASPVTVPASSGPMEKFCASVHPNADSCRDGAAAAVGLIGLLLVIAVAGYEVRKQWGRGDGA